MWTKIVGSIASDKKHRGKIIALGIGVIGLFLLVPAIAAFVLIAPVLAVVSFFTSLFGTGVKAPVHPLQAVASDVGCVANMFDINTIDIIENNLFSYSNDANEVVLEQKHAEDNPGIPFYSSGHKKQLKGRFQQYYFDSIEVDFDVNGKTSNLCGLRYLTDIFHDIEKNEKQINADMINKTVGELKKINNSYFSSVVNVGDLNTYNYGLSSPFPNYKYLPSSSQIKEDSKDLYQWHDDVENGHRGMDYPLTMGSPIYAMLDGIVVGTANSEEDGLYSNGSYIEGVTSSLGNFVSINSKFPGDENEDSNSFINHMYLHLRKNDVFVKVGDTVSRGDLLGYSGNSGKSTGPHLDFRVTLTSPEMDLKNELINAYSLVQHDLYMPGPYEDIERRD